MVIARAGVNRVCSSTAVNRVITRIGIDRVSTTPCDEGFGGGVSEHLVIGVQPQHGLLVDQTDLCTHRLSRVRYTVDQIDDFSSNCDRLVSTCVQRNRRFKLEGVLARLNRAGVALVADARIRN